MCPSCCFRLFQVDTVLPVMEDCLGKEDVRTCSRRHYASMPGLCQSMYATFIKVRSQECESEGMTAGWHKCTPAFQLPVGDFLVLCQFGAACHLALRSSLSSLSCECAVVVSLVPGLDAHV